MKHRSRIHMLTVAAARLAEGMANPKLVADLQAAAKEHASRKAQGMGWTPEDETRVERQRTLFAMLPSCNATDRLKEAIMQRAYDLLWDGDATACDAILEFVPTKDADALLNAWSSDQEGGQPKSKWYDAS